MSFDTSTVFGREPSPVEVRLRPGDYHKVRLAAAAIATVAFALLGGVWEWTPGLIVAGLALLEVGHASYHLRTSVKDRPALTILIDIVVVTSALAIMRPPAVAILPAFGYLVIAPILLASGKRSIAMVSLALIGFTGVGLVSALLPQTIDWTFQRTMLVTLTLLAIFGPIITWMIALTSRQLERREDYRRRLEASEQRLIDIFRNAPIGMELGVPGSWFITAANPALANMLGYEEAELEGMHLREIVHPDDLAATAHLAEQVASGTLDQFSTVRRYLHKDGRIIKGSFHLSAVRGPDGQPQFMIGQVLDITRQQETEDQRDLLLDLTMQVVAAPNTDDAMLAVLAGVGRFGRWKFGELWKPEPSGEMVRTHTWYDDPALAEFEQVSLDRMPVGSGLAGSVADGSFGISMVDVNTDERFLSSDLTAPFGLDMALGAPIRFQDQVVAVMTLLGPARHHITGATEETVQTVLAQLSYVIGARLAEEERDRLAAILENTTDLVSVSDVSGVIRYINPAGRLMLGIPLEEDVKGASITDWHPQEVAEELIAKALPVALSEGSWRGETTLLTRDGRETPISQVILAHSDSDGVRFFSTVGRDISSQKALEESQEALIDAKNQFIASVSHELRTPLTAIRGFAELLVDPFVSLAADERDEMLQSIVEEAKDVGNIVEDLLVAARADIDQLTVTSANLDLPALVRPVAESTRWQGQIVSLDLRPAIAVGDPLRIKQVVRNLCSNAARYGGSTVRVGTRTDHGRTVITVADDGPGIAVGDLEEIFAPYRRAHDEPGVPGSVGLGLAVSRQLARLMGGDIVCLLDDDWTVFEFSLPTGVLPG
jgi:PAS domain S-box-containing protein